MQPVLQSSRSWLSPSRLSWTAVGRGATGRAAVAAIGARVTGLGVVTWCRRMMWCRGALSRAPLAVIGPTTIDISASVKSIKKFIRHRARTKGKTILIIANDLGNAISGFAPVSWRVVGDQGIWSDGILSFVRPRRRFFRAARVASTASNPGGPSVWQSTSMVQPNAMNFFHGWKSDRPII